MAGKKGSCERLYSLRLQWTPCSPNFAGCTSWESMEASPSEAFEGKEIQVLRSGVFIEAP